MLQLLLPLQVDVVSAWEYAGSAEVHGDPLIMSFYCTQRSPHNCHTRSPRTPFLSTPMPNETWVLVGPGIHWPRANSSAYTSSLIHRSLSTRRCTDKVGQVAQLDVMHALEFTHSQFSQAAFMHKRLKLLLWGVALQFFSHKLCMVGCRLATCGAAIETTCKQ